MIFSLEKSVLFDTVYYMEIFFNKERLTESSENYGFNENIAFELYNTINISLKETDRTFFGYGNNNYSFMLFLLFAHIDKINSLEELINILQDKNYISGLFSEFYKDGLENPGEKGSGFEADPIITSGLLMVINDYDLILKNLIGDLHNVNSVIQKCYAENMHRIKYRLKLSDYISIINNFGCDTDEIEYYGISLLLPFNFKKSKTVWIFGYMADLSVNNRHNLSNVTLKSVLTILEDKLSVNILELLHMNGKPLSSDQILKHLNCSQLVLYMALPNLLSENAVIMHKEDGINYYSINNEYFKKASNIIDNKCMSFYQPKCD